MQAKAQMETGKARTPAIPGTVSRGKPGQQQEGGGFPNPFTQDLPRRIATIIVRFPTPFKA